MSAPKLTQTMKMHLNGGSKFSRLVYAILADGVDTGITRVTETSGRPKYLKTADVLHKGEESFDILATKGAGMQAWILERLAVQTVAPLDQSRPSTKEDPA